jgi:hypothetical protein
MSLEIVYTFRTLWRQRFYTCAVMLTMGLGLGANAVLAAVLETLYLRPLPYFEGSRIALSKAVWQPEGANHSTGGALGSGPVAVAAGYRSGEGTVVVGEEPLRVHMAAVTASFFEVFRDAPLRGRTFAGSDNSSRVGVVISQRLAANAVGHHTLIARRQRRTARRHRRDARVVRVSESSRSLDLARPSVHRVLRRRPVPEHGSSTDRGRDNRGGARRVAEAI